MSAFWNFVTQMTPGTLAKAEDVNTNLSGIDTGLDLVEAEIDKTIQIISSPGVTDIVLNAAARANKLLAFDENGDIAASQILGDWKGNHADAAGTDYEIRDVVKDDAAAIGQDNLYICNTTHTSTGDLATDTANWDLLVEVSGVAASAAAALVSENNAATSADFLDDRALGPYSTANEPTLDNDGNALLTGAQYFNTDLDRMKVYTGSVWQLNTAAAADVTIADSGAVYTATDTEDALQEVKLLADASTTKLAGIESGADVTDTANVTSAGALMDSEVDADIKTLSLPASVTISTFIKTLLDDANAATALATLLGAPLANPALTGNPTAPTQTAGNDSTRLATTAYVQAHTAGLQTKVIEIGDWNMDTTFTKNVAHGLTWTNIRTITVLIRADSGTAVVSFPHDPAPSSGGSGYISSDSTNINLKRVTDGYYDGTNYDSTSFNRGWITIQYVD